MAARAEERFLDQMKPSSDAEASWLRDVHTFIRGQVCPLLRDTGRSVDDSWTDASVSLSVCLVRALQDTSVSGSLPVSYRLVSISELVSHQQLPCVSCLSWNTNQHRAWVQEAELSVPNSKALPRVNLLLVGCLTEGRGGEWRLTDSSGSVRCELLSPSPDWLGSIVFLPHWNYIPHDASGQEETPGSLEVEDSPVLLCPEQRLVVSARGEAELRPVGVREATGLMRNRSKGQRLSLWGEVSSVNPLLVIGGTTFFCFTLSEETHSQPVLVKDTRLWWSQCVCVGQRVCVTSLRVCDLRSWRGKTILCVTDRSQLHTDYSPTHTRAELQMDTPTDEDTEPQEAETEREVGQSGAPLKKAKVISYQGVVTEVVNEGAGLYVMDRTVGLCLAYLPSLRRKLRAGDAVELHNVHFLYRPCPDFPPSMLCTCLSSSVRVSSFSRVGWTPSETKCPGDKVLPRLLLEKNMTVGQYLWACHLSSQLSVSLVPCMERNQCVCVLSWKLMELLWGQRRRQRRRDIYSEMLDQPHSCSLSQYSVHPAVHQYISVAELVHSLKSHCWSSVCLSSLLPPDGAGLMEHELNARLAWFYTAKTSDSEDRQRPLLLVGMLELPSHSSKQRHTLQLRDGTAAVACVLTEASEGPEGGQRAAFNTAWIGCLVCVHQFTMVTERFLQSHFPSYQHLDQEQFITDKRCSVYLQFSLDHIHILSPSAAMATHQKRAQSVDSVTEGQADANLNDADEEDETRASRGSKAKSWSCVSVVLKVEQKEGVAQRPASEGTHNQEVELVSHFTLRAAVVGPVVSWDQDPKNRPMTEEESDQEKEEKVVLVFSGVSTRWFPLLHSGCFYRLVAANNQNPRVLIGCGVSGRNGVEVHADSTLEVKADWRFHTLTRPLLLHTYTQALSSKVLSVSEVLDSSTELVSFQGLVSDRTSVTNRKSDGGRPNTGVRLTVCDQSGRSLQVYLTLSHALYPPGLLPGNSVLLSTFQRKASRSGSVYCRQVPISAVTVTSLTDKRSAPPTPPPMMHLCAWALCRDQKVPVARLKVHAVCVLFLQLKWSCSLCGSLYRQSRCSSQCGFTSSVFQAKVKLVIDDGTGEAHVWFSGVLVRSLLQLAESQWEGLQRALRVRSQVRLYARGHGLVCDDDTEDTVVQYLMCVCSKDAVCRPLSLTCRKHTDQSLEEVRRFTRGDRDFMTRMTPPIQLTCLHLDADTDQT